MCVKPMVEKWVEGVKALAKVATRYPQSAYHGFTQSLQSEWWQYLCHCVPGVDVFVRPVENTIREFLVTAMLREKTRVITAIFFRFWQKGSSRVG